MSVSNFVQNSYNKYEVTNMHVSVKWYTVLRVIMCYRTLGSTIILTFIPYNEMNRLSTPELLEKK